MTGHRSSVSVVWGLPGDREASDNGGKVPILGQKPGVNRFKLSKSAETGQGQRMTCAASRRAHSGAGPFRLEFRTGGDWESVHRGALIAEVRGQIAEVRPLFVRKWGSLG